MSSVGLRELRQDASELVRRVEGGEQIDITVAGRLVARLVPVTSKQWQPWEAIAGMFVGSSDVDGNQIAISLITISGIRGTTSEGVT